MRFKSSSDDGGEVKLSSLRGSPVVLYFYPKDSTPGCTTEAKDFRDRIKDFDKALELDPEYAEAYYNRGLANYHQGRLHDACFDWRKAHSLGHYEAEKAIRGYCEGKKEE